jgi:hypothetical protein
MPETAKEDAACAGVEYEDIVADKEEKLWKSEYEEFLSTQKEKDFPVIDDGAVVDLNAPLRFFPGTKYVKLEKTGMHSTKYTMHVRVSRGEEIPREFITDTFVLPKDAGAVDGLFSGCERCEVSHTWRAPYNPAAGRPDISKMSEYLRKIGCRNVISYV